MKEFKLLIPFENKKIDVYIGRSEYLHLKSKRFAIDFKAKYQKLVNKNIRNLNNIHNQVYQLYRNYYFEFDNKTENNILKNLHIFDNQFNAIFKPYSEENHNSFSMHSIGTCFKYSSDSLYYMLEFAHKYKNYSLKHQAQSLSDLLLHLEKKFDKDRLKIEIVHQEPKLRVLKTSKEQEIC